MPSYQKLVRDNTPAIIKKNGQKPIYRRLGNKEFTDELVKKLTEAVEEYKADNNVEELADILEVIYTLACLHNCTPEQLESIRAKKTQERGGFKNKTLLIDVDEG